ncbi:hypothetical protein [Mesorhizobium sp. M1A.F.Ca.IN.020.04.1.1]|uniref:hypothetical protein n=1 Tax=Mesorhizobium sp. M1A.F.Ca.IN.020.04.1.1 TaxID=2496761 RepID=UPI000FCA0433|nr:hypothetical protein [Mesorhizobium sp. M1A.F.Ca.IN.020.04.1.1]RUW04063.1 hypothetical protein EOA49_00615 [Mesorhizobium sp. M1A.F.Ca.IN.020.04.1.1]RUW04126.1 hypothetical protein EOA49_00950 [Mesorhizobium sp. M1A.F.Ca.IN.020.04.1.1]
MGENPRFWVAFSILLATLALATFMTVFLTIQAHAEIEPQRPLQVIDIQNDGGGSVMTYYKNYKRLSDEGAIIRYRGMCASSCTLVLLKEFTGIKACAADAGAFFAFHKPFILQDGKVVRTKSAARGARKLWSMWLKSLPDGLHRYLQKAKVPSAAEGDEPNTMLFLPANLLLPKCPTVAAQ